MREIEADSEVFIRKLDWILEAIEHSTSEYTFHTLFQHSNNKLKIEIDNTHDEERKLIYVFYHRQQHFFKSMERKVDFAELKFLLNLVKESFSEDELVRNAHITLGTELYYFVHWGLETES